MHRVVAALALTILTSPLVAGPASADFTCSTVVRNGSVDPEGRLFSTTFGTAVATNGLGDVLFTARPAGQREHLYFYPDGAAAQIIAPASGFAPNGGAFRSIGAFSAASVNDAGDIAFHGRLVAGTGIFTRPNGSSLAVVAETTGAAPPPIGGFFHSFPAVSAINSSGDIAFVAAVAGGTAPVGVFLYDTTSATTSFLFALEDTTASGRELCALLAVGLGDSGMVAVRATSKIDCSDGVETPRDGVFFTTGGAIEVAALEGEAAPVGGTTFASFEGSPSINANDRIAFRATVGGLVSRGGVFVHDHTVPSTDVGILRGDAAPFDGAVGKLSWFALDDSDRVVIRSSVIGGTSRFGVFAFGPILETVLANTSTPPTDLFSPGASYLRIGDPGLSTDGDHLVVKVRLRDPIAPRSRRAIIRCER